MFHILARLGTIGLVCVATLDWARASPVAAAFPGGTWQTEDGRARIRTERCGSAGSELCGFVVWLRAPVDDKGRAWLDSRNPDLAKQKRLILGHQVILGLSPTSGGKYEGKVYNSDTGKYYEVSAWLNRSDQLVVKGCLLVFCGTEAWRRTSGILKGQLQGKTNSSGGPRTDPAWSDHATETGSIIERRKRPENN